MDQATRQILLDFVRTVGELPNESAKTHQFFGLLEQLFRGSRISIDVARGVEKVVRIETGDGSKLGRIDAYYGRTIIEFENSLNATLSDALEQLCEYSAALWQTKEESRRPILCIATDCLEWKIYRPVVRPSAPERLRPSDVMLEELRSIKLEEKTLDEFWLFLTSLLFKPGQRQPTPDAFIFDFGALSIAFSDAQQHLHAAWNTREGQPESQLKFDSWKRYLTFAYGSLESTSELEDLFVKHTFLANLARLLVWAALSRGKTKKPLREVAGDVLDGAYFRALRIENLAEDDFFHWVLEGHAAEQLESLWERILAQLLTYDLSAIDHDLLKGIYQELVDPSDRHDLGEYYTPDWLCDAIVRRLLPETGFPRVLDPSCGSGTFLRASIAHLISHNQASDAATKLVGVLGAVAGIDIHPLAVIIARATYVIALGELIHEADHSLQIPVYLADSLFLPVEVKQFELGEEPSYRIDFGGQSVNLPEGLVRTPELFDEAIVASTSIAVEHAQSKSETAESLRRYLERRVPALGAREDAHACFAALWQFTNRLAELIRRRQDSIWSFIVRNAYRPAMLRRSFDYLIGNPPWLTYNAIKDPKYQEEIKRRAVDEYGIAPRSQSLFTHMELATVFLAHSLQVFGADNARLGFVMPRSVLSADQHATLRARSYNARMKVSAYWDLVDVHPLFNVPSCVLFAKRTEVGRPPISYEIPAVEWRGQLPRKNASPQEAAEALRRRKRVAHLIYLGTRNALSTLPGKTTPQVRSSYAGRFKQGATIVPRNFYYVASEDFDGRIRPKRSYWLETDEGQAKTAKKPYKEVRLSGEVEGEFLYFAPLAKHVLPFVLLDPPLVVLPLDRLGSAMSPKELNNAGWRGMGSWLTKADRIFRQKQKAKNAMSAIERLDYQNGLGGQDFSDGYLVLYAATGKNISACAVELAAVDKRFKVDHTLYWCHCGSAGEAHYVAAVLNSRAVNAAIKPFQSRGLLGERHVHKKVLDLPIPHFDPANLQHASIAVLGEAARTVAVDLQATGALVGALAQQRMLVRETVGIQLSAIDELVKGLLTN